MPQRKYMEQIKIPTINKLARYFAQFLPFHVRTPRIINNTATIKNTLMRKNSFTERPGVKPEKARNQKDQNPEISADKKESIETILVSNKFFCGSIFLF
jgi:hypothetical protein